MQRMITVIENEEETTVVCLEVVYLVFPEEDTITNYGPSYEEEVQMTAYEVKKKAQNKANDTNCTTKPRKTLTKKILTLCVPKKLLHS